MLENSIKAIIEANSQISGKTSNLSEAEKKEAARKIKLHLKKEKQHSRYRRHKL
jgi:hypothetical protein